MNYLDTSALVKLIAPEPESSALAAWMAGIGGRFTTSVVGRVELRRVARRVGRAAIDDAERVLDVLHIVAWDASVETLAVTAGSTHLRTLDAMHVASAQILGPALKSFCTYDRRMGADARAIGLPVVHPGATEV